MQPNRVFSLSRYFFYKLTTHYSHGISRSLGEIWHSGNITFKVPVSLRCSKSEKHPGLSSGALHDRLSPLLTLDVPMRNMADRGS